MVANSNIVEELQFLKQIFDVRYVEFSNNSNLNIFDIFAFVFNSNYLSNKKIKDSIQEFNPDFAYVHNTWFKASLGIFNILKKNNVPIFLKLHNFRYACSTTYSVKKHLNGNNICPRCGLERGRYKFFNKYYNESFLKSIFLINYGKKYIEIIKNYSINIFVLTKFHRESLVQLGVDANKVNIYLNPMNLNLENMYNNASNYIVYAGRLTESKGILELIEAFINSKIVDINLKIIGDGDLYKKLKFKYQKENIEFLGELTNLKTMEYIKNSLAVVSATKMFEGQPRASLRSFHAWDPSIYPSFGGLNEFFPNDYKLSFTQYDYQDLTEKIKMIKNKDLLKESSKDVNSYIKALLDSSKLKIELDKFINSS